MEANARNLERIFDSTVSYQIPLFQRPYVWNEEKNWLPLWEDIQSQLDRELNKLKTRPHFLGAVVLEQLNNASGSIEARQVIDGQQRFTTLQLFMIAVRDLCKQLDNQKYFERFNDLVTNKESKVDHDYEAYKIWPTNSDREAFKVVHRSHSPSAIDAYLKEHPDLDRESHQIIKGYKFFHWRLNRWVDELVEQGKDRDDCLEILWQVIRNHLQIVVIDLDREDESQVIFETLNARGTQLLPADLIKNYLFRRGQNDGEDTESLYRDYWRAFDSRYWRTEIKQGRIKRPRIDLFLQHYLTLMLREEVKTSHLFESFKQYVLDLEDGEIEASDALTSHPDSIEGHLVALRNYAKAFRTFLEAEEGTRLSVFMRRLTAVDTTTVYPLLLLACNKILPESRDEFDSFLQVLESFLIRRMVCGLTTKNYNRLFIDAIRYLDKQGGFTAAKFETFLKDGKGESTRFPDDQEFRHALEKRPLYRNLAQYKLRAVLEAIDNELQDNKSENIALPNNLTIEHVLPKEWREFWPLPEHLVDDPETRVRFVQNRNDALHTLGNLTLITGSLNPSLSNAGWAKKRPELLKFSKLNLNRYFHKPTDGSDDELENWNETTIAQRGQRLATLALNVW